jgi:hypothetical protein
MLTGAVKADALDKWPEGCSGILLTEWLASNASSTSSFATAARLADNVAYY